MGNSSFCCNGLLLIFRFLLYQHLLSIYHTGILEDERGIKHDGVDAAPLLQDLHGDGGDERKMIGLVGEQHAEGVSLRGAGLVLDLFLLHLVQLILNVLRAAQPLKGGSRCLGVVFLNVKESVGGMNLEGGRAIRLDIEARESGTYS